VDVSHHSCREDQFSLLQPCQAAGGNSEPPWLRVQVFFCYYSDVTLSNSCARLVTGRRAVTETWCPAALNINSMEVDQFNPFKSKVRKQAWIVFVAKFPLFLQKTEHWDWFHRVDGDASSLKLCSTNPGSVCKHPPSPTSSRETQPTTLASKSKRLMFNPCGKYAKHIKSPMFNHNYTYDHW
jgi:hypothetical protein